jgi:hypothetical protein
MALISEFDFEIKHIKGKENRVADALNRSMQTIHLATTSTCESDIKKRIRNSLQNDEQFNLIKESLQQEPKGKKYEGYQLTEDGLLMYNNILYIPNSIELKNLIMDEFHRRPYVGHPGYQKMITTTRKLYFWPGDEKGYCKYIVGVWSANKSRLSTNIQQVCCSQCRFQNGNGRLSPWTSSWDYQEQQDNMMQSWWWWTS